MKRIIVLLSMLLTPFAFLFVPCYAAWKIAVQVSAKIIEKKVKKYEQSV